MNKYFIIFTAALFTLGIFSCKKEKPDYSKGFVKYFGGVNVESASDVRQTSDGGFIIVGTTSSYGNGGSDMYALKTDAFGNVQWNKTFGDILDDEGSAVLDAGDGYLFLGTYRYVSPGLDSNKTDMFLVKTSFNGSVLWTKKYGTVRTNEKGVSIVSDQSGGFMVGGNTDSKGAGVMIFTNINSEGSRTRYSNDGKVYVYTGSNYETYPSTVTDSTSLDKLVNIFKNPSGEYVFSSYAYAAGENNKINSPRIGFLKANPISVPNAPTSKEFNESALMDGGNAGEAAATNDGNYILTGKTNSSDVFVLKFRSTQTIWFKTYGGAGLDEGSSILATPDGGYIVLGSTYSFGAGSKDIYLLKLNGNGDVEWTKTFGGAGSDEGRVVRLTSDGGYVILGTLEFGDDPSNADNIITLIRVNSKGEIKN